MSFNQNIKWQKIMHMMEHSYTHESVNTASVPRQIRPYASRNAPL